LIWKEDINLDELNSYPPYSRCYLGIQFTAWTENSLVATMPVNEMTKQPFGILHGGASVVLAETLGTFASSLVVDTNQLNCVGLEINANHLRPVRTGNIRAVCHPIHLGKMTHVWDIRLFDTLDKIVCICRFTVAILARQ